MDIIHKAAMVVIDTGKSWLLQKRDNIDGIWWPGKVGCWGGKVEPEDKSPLDGAYREIEEELNLTREDILLTPIKTETVPFVDMEGIRGPLEYHYFVGKLLNDNFLHAYEGEAIIEVPYDFDFTPSVLSFSPNLPPAIEALREIRRREATT